MKIKKFKLFESNLESNFPSLDEVKTYFYDFTDNIGNISGFEVGYVYFESTRYSKINYNLYSVKAPTEYFIDISNTTLTNNHLGLMSDYLIINREVPDNKKNKLKYILSGDIPSYEYMCISFNDSLFDEEDNLEVLINCLKILYSETGFRPFGCLWTEDSVSYDGDVATKIGFEGTFFRGSDDEYLKFCKIFDRGDLNRDLVKYFI
jgi:hypothetical protein